MGIAILIAVVLVGGIIGGLAGEFSDHPNVPRHVVDACASALADSGRVSGLNRRANFVRRSW